MASGNVPRMHTLHAVAYTMQRYDKTFNNEIFFVILLT